MGVVELVGFRLRPLRSLLDPVSELQYRLPGLRLPADSEGHGGVLDREVRGGALPGSRPMARLFAKRLWERAHDHPPNREGWTLPFDSVLAS
jgi:hypothetical protein